MKRKLLGTTYLVKVGYEKTLKETFVLIQRDILRWLSYRESGVDPGPISKNSVLAPFFKERYLTRLWDLKTLKEEKENLSEEEFKVLIERLNLILSWAQPFLKRQKTTSLFVAD